MVNAKAIVWQFIIVHHAIQFAIVFYEFENPATGGAEKKITHPGNSGPFNCYFAMRSISKPELFEIEDG